MAGAKREVVGTKKTGADNKKSKDGMRIAKNTFVDGRGETVFNLTKPATEPAKEYEGVGTSLKPATEPVCFARKPIEKGLNVAQNVLKWGTGGINLDGCAIEFSNNEQDSRVGTNALKKSNVGNKFWGMDNENEQSVYKNGRFPSNVIFDPLMANELNKQTGILTSGKPSGKRNAQSNIYGVYQTGQDVTGFGDSGGASRFFYCAKSSQFERNAGCEHLDAIKTNDGREIEADNAYQRGKNERNNHHPTVKPISLMSYLQRLVTPKGGKTLDPFAGSGTSGCSAYFENIGEIVLMEMGVSYFPIIEARTRYWSVEKHRTDYLDEIRTKKEEFVENQLKMF